jgi:hypothetical protein
VIRQCFGGPLVVLSAAVIGVAGRLFGGRHEAIWEILAILLLLVGGIVALLTFPVAVEVVSRVTLPRHKQVTAPRVGRTAAAAFWVGLSLLLFEVLVVLLMWFFLSSLSNLI